VHWLTLESAADTLVVSRISGVCPERLIVVSEILLNEEVSEMTRVPLATLRYWRQINKGPKSFRLGNRVAYKRSDVEAWIEAQYVAAAGE
jgi:predicted DNA-binding transcriptional regulator AlpA